MKRSMFVVLLSMILVACGGNSTSSQVSNLPTQIPENQLEEQVKDIVQGHEHIYLAILDSCQNPFGQDDVPALKEFLDEIFAGYTVSGDFTQMVHSDSWGNWTQSVINRLDQSFQQGWNESEFAADLLPKEFVNFSYLTELNRQKKMVYVFHSNYGLHRRLIEENNNFFVNPSHRGDKVPVIIWSPPTDANCTNIPTQGNDVH